MESSLGRDTLPSQARSVRGECRQLRRERDNARTLLFRRLLQWIAQRDHTLDGGGDELHGLHIEGDVGRSSTRRTNCPACGGASCGSAGSQPSC